MGSPRAEIARPRGAPFCLKKGVASARRGRKPRKIKAGGRGPLIARAAEASAPGRAENFNLRSMWRCRGWGRWILAAPAWLGARSGLWGGAMRRFSWALLIGFLAGTARLAAAEPFINELHYDNSGSDAGEGVEIAGPAGTDLAAYDLVFYNGSSRAVYLVVPLSGRLPDEAGGGFGARWFALAGLQNGDPDGVALVARSSAQVLQWFAYDGSFAALGGAADGLFLSNLGVGESASTPVGHSLQLRGAGAAAGDFTWQGPFPASPGTLNAGQVFGAVAPRSALSFSPGLLREGESAVGTFRLSPAPPQPVEVALRAEGPLELPTSVRVPASGSVQFSVRAPLDGIPDGFAEAAVWAGDASMGLAGAGLQIVDADRPARSAPNALRLVTLNVRLGLGAPGSAEFAAVREVVERLSPDVLLLQEVSNGGDFGDARALLEQVGFPGGAAFWAAEGEAFAGQTYRPGDFGDGACLFTASRYPIVRRVQIGRGVAGRQELTRFPLFTTLDLPGPDLHVVNVHLKAGTGDADRFRKAVEAYRIREFLAQAGLRPESDDVVLGGDCNAVDTLYLPALSYATSSYLLAAGASLPQSYQLGSDLATPPGLVLPYSAPPFAPASSVYPHQGFNPAGLFAPTLFQADGSTGATFNLFDARFDYFFLPQRLQANGQARGEVYNSRRESQADGLPKRRSLPRPELSEIASDHYAVFLDIDRSPAPSLRLTVSPSELDESAEFAPWATVSLQPPPAAPVTVHLESWRDQRVQFALDGVTLTSAQPSAAVPLRVPFSPLVEPRRAIALRARAAGYAPAYASLAVRSAEASGQLLFSQYIEPPASPGPGENGSRALELYNASGETLDLARLRWEVLRYTNGSLSPTKLAQTLLVVPANSPALLPAGQVVVVGEAAVGEALVAAGLLPSPSPSFAEADPHTLFCNPAGQAVFLKGSNLDFNGDDALEIVADGVRSDVFGRIGQDPGSAWSAGPGQPSSADQNLALRPEIATGSTGFDLPNARFATLNSGASLAGLGLPPLPTDPYLAWAESHGLRAIARAPNSDPDADGRPNLLEFAQITDPTRGDAPSDSAAFPPSALTLNPDPWLRISWERGDLAGPWLPAPEVQPAAFGPQRTLWQWPPPEPAAPRRFWRLRVARP